MLGTFSVYMGDAGISDSAARSKKLWLIFKYIITNRHKVVTTEALIDMLWPDGQPVNPLKLLYTHMSRLRRLIQTEDDESQYIQYRQNGYQWNAEAPVEIDVVLFESMIQAARDAGPDEERQRLLEQAIELYKGDYLTESAHEPWVMPVTNYYRRMYLRAVGELADIYEGASAQEEIIALCNRAVQVEPFEESLHERLIRAMLMSGDIQQAKRQYRHVADIMQKEFGAMPSDELQALNMEMRELIDAPLDLSEIKNKLESLDRRHGALFCTSDMFKQIYLIDKRSKRMPFPVFLALITVSDPGGGTLEERQRKRIMRTLRQCLMRTLRQGDVVSQYSKSQYLMMLTAALIKDVEAALTRVKRMFYSEHSEKDCKLDITLSQVGLEGTLLRGT